MSEGIDTTLWVVKRLHYDDGVSIVDGPMSEEEAAQVVQKKNDEYQSRTYYKALYMSKEKN